MSTAEGKILVPHLSVEEICRRNPELKISDLYLLKDWMSKQPHLPKIDIFYLISFLYSNYYRIEPSKKMIENYFTLRTHIPEIFSNRDPIACEKLQEMFDSIMVTMLEQESCEGYIMIFATFIDPDTSKFNFCEGMKYILMVSELYYIIRNCTKPAIIILDVSGFSFDHLARVQFVMLKKVNYFVNECMPVRLMGIHILNITPAINMILNMIKPFIKSKMLKLIYTHTSLESVEKFLPIEVLPNESGGKGGSIKELAIKNIKLLEKYREYFEYDEHHHRVNESLRIGKCQTMETLFGVDGNFTKLEID